MVAGGERELAGLEVVIRVAGGVDRVVALEAAPVLVRRRLGLHQLVGPGRERRPERAQHDGEAAEASLVARGIRVVPDLVANAGGVLCSYFEQVQSNQNYFWTKDEVLSKLDQKMTDAYYAVSEMARKHNVYMRDAAYMIAVSRVAQACKMRGWV